jgi:hypothetical protein
MASLKRLLFSVRLHARSLPSPSISVNDSILAMKGRSASPRPWMLALNACVPKT